MTNKEIAKAFEHKLYELTQIMAKSEKRMSQADEANNEARYSYWLSVKHDARVEFESIFNMACRLGFKIKMVEPIKYKEGVKWYLVKV